MPHILHLDTDECTVESVGGKGWNLAKMAQTSSVVKEFPESRNRTDSQTISASLSQITAQSSLQELEEASSLIRTAIESREMPAGLSAVIMAAWVILQEKTGGASEVAVRSSATAEDTAAASFAGAQDTYLHVKEDGLIEAVRNCWGSLYSARAIGYRAQINWSAPLSLAVVVQAMCVSEQSGVAFTANPLTGNRDELTLNIVNGLGEALVSGLVEPDQYVISVAEGEAYIKMVEKRIGKKGLAIIRAATGGVERISQDARHADDPALPDHEVLKLALLCRGVQAAYNAPMDIEWGRMRGRFYLLQARPITTLFPQLNVEPRVPPFVTVSFGSVQGLSDPFSPLGQHFVRLLMGGAGHRLGVFHYPQIQARPDDLMLSAGERAWLNVDYLLQYPVGRRVVQFLSYGMDKVFWQVAERQLARFPDFYHRHWLPLKPRLLVRLLGLFGPTWPRYLLSWLKPESFRAWWEASLEDFRSDIEADIQSAADLTQKVELALKWIPQGLPFALAHAYPCLLVAMPCRLIIQLMTSLEDVDILG